MSPILVLKFAAIVLIVTGLVSGLAAFPATAAPWALLFDLVRWPLDGAEGAFSDEARLLNGIHAGVLAGWGVMMYGLIAGPVARGDEAMRRLCLTSVVVWFVLDSLGSIAAGWPGNVALNVVFLVLFAAPLMALKPGGLAAAAAQKGP